MKLYRFQVESGRLFIHEHPNSASTWKMQEMTKLTEDIGFDKVVGHMFRFGTNSKDEQGAGPVKKPKGTLSNSSFVKDQLERKCV